MRNDDANRMVSEADWRLSYALANADEAGLIAALKDGANPNAQNGGAGRLAVAMIGAHPLPDVEFRIRALRLLIAAGADLEANLEAGSMVAPLRSAAWSLCEKGVKALLEAGACPNSREGGSYLHYLGGSARFELEHARMAAAGRMDSLENAASGCALALLEAGMDWRLRDSQGRSGSDALKELGLVKTASLVEAWGEAAEIGRVAKAGFPAPARSI